MNSSRRLFSRFVLTSALSLTLVFASFKVYSELPVNKSADFVLSAQCPQGFELTDKNECLLRSLYQFYDSTQNRGVGGTQTGLPPYRDGFSPQEIDLGRFLFFDPLLSVDNTVACASCHQPEKGFSDDMAVSVGVEGRTGRRSSPTLWNVAFLPFLFWDARAKTLEEQAEGPLFSMVEMANTPEQLLSDLRANEHYPRMFKQAYPAQSDISLDSIYRALAAFQTSLISLNSRYDQYAHGNHDVLNEQEIAGLNVFRSFVARCAECHTPPLFTNNQIAVIGTPEPDNGARDIGAQATFDSPKLRGGFKVPTLRNITKTAPYMHSGGMKTLAEAAAFYTKGRGHAVPEGEELLIHWHIWEPDLRADEIDMLVAFLGTLEDERFMPKIPSKNPSGLAPAVPITQNNNN